MATEYSVTAGSFIRNGSYPLEADYIFPSVEALQEYCSENEGILHDGLLKVVKTEDKQILYWCIGTEAFPLIESDTLDNLNKVLEDFELHGTLRDLLRDLSNSINSKLKALQQELDTTQSGAGLNGDGSFDQMTMKNTTYLDGSTSIIECLKALDREMSGLVVDAFVQDAYYDTATEEIVLTFITKQDKTKTIRISMTNLIREWEPYNDHPTKVVEITREEVYGGGADRLSADVRISPNQYNILRKEGNTLLVEGTSSNILHGSHTVADEFTKVHEEIEKVKAPDPFVFSSYSEIIGANLKPGSVFYLTQDITLLIDNSTLTRGFYVLNDVGKYEVLSLDSSINDELKKQVQRINTLIGQSGTRWQSKTGSTYTSTSSDITDAIYDLDRTVANNVAYRKNVTGLQNEYTPHAGTVIKDASNLHAADKILADTVAETVADLAQKTADTYTPESADTYTITKINGDTKDVQLTFTPLSPSTLTVPETIGDITQGTTAESLKGKPISEILDSILFKTIYPTITDPSVTITHSIVIATVEAGSALITGLNYNFNKGSVVVSDGTTATTNYVGNSIGVTYYINKAAVAAAANAGTSAYPAVANATSITRYEPGTYKYKATVNYAVGPIMKTSKGTSPNPMPTTNKGNVTNPHPVGSVTSSEGVTRNVTLPVWIDVADGTYTKKNLLNWGIMTYTGVAMKDTSKDSPIRILTPRKLQYVNSYNELSGKYDVPQLNQFIMTSLTKDINGANYPYYEYVWNGGAQGAVNMEIKTY